MAEAEYEGGPSTIDEFVGQFNRILRFLPEQNSNNQSVKTFRVIIENLLRFCDNLRVIDEIIEYEEVHDTDNIDNFLIEFNDLRGKVVNFFDEYKKDLTKRQRGLSRLTEHLMYLFYNFIKDNYLIPRGGGRKNRNTRHRNKRRRHSRRMR